MQISLQSYKFLVRSLFILLFLFFFSMYFVNPAHTSALTEGANVVIDSSNQISLTSAVFERVSQSWPWYLTRVSGLVGAAAMVLLMLSGIGFITGRTYALLEPLTAWATHRTLGIILTISIALHMGALYFDHYVPFSLADLFIPFWSDFAPVSMFGFEFGSLYIAMGILAFYMVVGIVLVSLVWKENKTKTWKYVHLMSYLAMFFVFIHAITIGTDLAGGLLRFIWIALGLSILVASIVRLWRAFTV